MTPQATALAARHVAERASALAQSAAMEAYHFGDAERFRRAGYEHHRAADAHGDAQVAADLAGDSLHASEHASTAMHHREIARVLYGHAERRTP